MELKNIYLDDKDELLVLDYENATLGPLFWDETTLVYSFIEKEQYEIAKKLYEHFSIEREMLIAISCIRLAQSIKKNQNVSCFVTADVPPVYADKDDIERVVLNILSNSIKLESFELIKNT